MITKDINLVKAYLRDGKNVVVPTETVYGLAGSIFSDDALKSIFSIKKRPFENPLIVHVSNKSQIRDLVTEIHPKIELLIDTFMPGPLTVVLPRNEKVSKYITAGKSTVAIRIPDHDITRKLIEEIGFPIAAPSANPFQQISPTTAKQVAHYFSNLDLPILDGGQCNCGIESTIVGMDKDMPIIFRKGAISIERIEQLVGKVYHHVPKSIHMPGMYKKHYSPLTPLKLVTELSELSPEDLSKQVGLLIFSEGPTLSSFKEIRVLSETENEMEAIKNLYNYLFELDQAQLDLIVAVKVSTNSEIAKLINERLEQASN